MTKKKKSSDGKTENEYPGELGKPIVYPHPLFMSTEDAGKFVQNAKLKKLELLREHLGVEAGLAMHFGMVLRLAEKHVPGFKVIFEAEKPLGRPAKFAGKDGLILYCRVRIYQIESNSDNDVQALLHLREQHTEYHQYEQEVFCRRYKEVKSKVRNLEKAQDSSDKDEVRKNSWFIILKFLKSIGETYNVPEKEMLTSLLESIEKVDFLN